MENILGILSLTVMTVLFIGGLVAIVQACKDEWNKRKH